MKLSSLTPSPVPNTPVHGGPAASEVDAPSEASEAEVAFDITADLVTEQLGRSRWRPTSRGAAAAAAETALPAAPAFTRPGRLEAAVRHGGEDPLCRRLEDCTGGGAARASPETCEELPAFKHLAALEEAVNSGDAFAGRLPSLPASLRGDRAALPTPEATMTPRSARGRSVPLWSRGGPFAKTPLVSQSSRAVPALGGRRSGGYLIGEGVRVVCHEDGGWGVRPPSFAGAKVHAAATPLAFGRSALNGAPLPRWRAQRGGPAATALWIGTERERLQAEAPKSFGCSATVAFLQNGGPEGLEPLDAELCRPEILA